MKRQSFLAWPVEANLFDPLPLGFREAAGYGGFGPAGFALRLGFGHANVACAHGQKLADRLQFGKPRFNSTTPTGRATVWRLQMNTAERMELRAEL